MSASPRAASASSKPLTFAILVALAPLVLHAAEPPPIAPDSGTILQQLKPAKPPAPASPDTGLTIEQPNVTQAPAGEAFAVKRFEI